MKKWQFLKHYLIVPLVLAVFFILFYLVYADIKERTINEFNKEQLLLAQTASHGITSFFSDYQTYLSVFSQIDDIIDFTEDSKALMARYYENQKDIISAITLIDSNGIILYTYPIHESLTGKDISYQKHVSQVLSTRQPVISDVFESVQGYLAIAMHIPVFKGKTFVGSLAVLIPIDMLGRRYLKDISPRGTENVWLMSEKGVEIYCLVTGHLGKSFLEITNYHAAADDFFELITKSANGTAISIHKVDSIDGHAKFMERHIAFYRASFSNTYWTILISYDENDVYIALTRLRNRLILIFSAFFLIILYYFYTIAKVRTVLKEETKRKAAEKTLLESEEKFKTLFEESPIGIEFYDAEGLLKNANKASLNMFGISDVSELKNFNLFEGTTLDAEKNKKLRRGEIIAYQQLFDFDQVKALNQYHTSKSGTAYFDYVITPLFETASKTISGYLLQVQDISERKRAEYEVLILAHSLRSVNECVSITDMNDKILFVNESFLETYGYTNDELIGKHLDFLRAPGNPSEKIDEILPATKEGSWKGELRNKRKDGSEFLIYLSTTIIRNKDGKPLGLIGVASDITERKRMEEELIQAKEKAEESDRLKSAFLANMSHEIRTPMSGILGFASLLREPMVTGEEQQNYIKIIEKSGARMLAIINDIINISKVESGQMEVNVSATNINEQMDDIHYFFQKEAEGKGLRMTCHKTLPDEKTILKTDAEKVFAILSNLVKNAIKYCDEGFIDFGYQLKPAESADGLKGGEVMEFYIKDTGIGIAADRQKAIFERFIQADIVDKMARQGAGLGLSISRAYVEMLGGRLWVESEPDKGSVFYFTLPYLQETEAEAEPVQSTEKLILTDPEVKDLTILIVEDDETSEALITRFIQPISREVLKARSGDEAVDICQNNGDIDLILMDIQLPDTNGYEATKQIRQFNKEVFIIAQTAFGLSGDREKALEAGCDNYISKPIDKNELRAIIQEHFTG